MWKEKIELEHMGGELSILTELQKGMNVKESMQNFEKKIQDKQGSYYHQRNCQTKNSTKHPKVKKI